MAIIYLDPDGLLGRAAEALVLTRGCPPPPPAPHCVWGAPHLRVKRRSARRAEVSTEAGVAAGRSDARVRRRGGGCK